MKRFGVTTVARWLGEELPPGVTAYTEYRGRLFELLRLEAVSGSLFPTLRTLADRRGQFSPPNTVVNLETPVILSLCENLAGTKLAELEGDLVAAATNSWATTDLINRSQINKVNAKDEIHPCYGHYCG